MDTSLAGGGWEPKWSFMAAEPQPPCEAAPHLSPLHLLTTLLSLLPLLRSIENLFLPAVFNEGLWSCVPIPDGLCFKGHPFAWLLGGWGWGLGADKTFAKRAQLLGCFST